MSPERLSTASLARLPATVRRFGYDRSALEPAIVHLGLGAFVRAHLAAYTEDVLERRGGAWGMVGASLRSPDQRDRLAPQEHLYTVCTLAPEGTTHRVFGCVIGSLVGPDDPAALVARMAAPTTRIVSLTVTEKGYCHDPARGALDLAHPDIRHDLAGGAAPRSTIGFIVAALAARRAVGLPPFTVLTCDNLPSNGHLLRGLVLAFARERDADLARYIAGEVPFPSTMVDRIVPATTDADRDAVVHALGLVDEAAIVAEPFRQWVIEDAFASGRPAWEDEGAEIVADVAPFELMKLRLLNGAHSTLAYLGQLAGFETVSEASSDPTLAAVLERLWREVRPTVPRPAPELEAYTGRLAQRFRNPSIRHRTAQIAMDGSQKLPQRLLGPVRDRLAAGAPIDALTLAVAAWMAFVARSAQDGAAPLSDPLGAELTRRARSAGADPETLVSTLLDLPAVFGADLPADPRLRKPLAAALASIRREGPLATAEAMLAGRLTPV
jgi:fructuronate reductase